MPNLIGTAPNQVPTNGSLGNMAFQNKEGVIVDLLSTTALTVTGTGPLIVGGTQFVKDASGNVGIGTASPSFKLDVQGNSASVATFVRSRNGDTSATSFAGYGCSTGEGVDAQWYSYSSANWFGTKTNHPQLFITNNTERLRITSAGNVGIGTSSPPAQQTLTAGRNMTGSTFSSGVASTGQVQSDATSRADYFISVSSVAAGTYSRVVGYQAQQGTITGTVNNQYGFQADASLIGATYNMGFFGNIPDGTNRWNFYAQGTAPNYFAGNVGIGTNAPATKLDVSGNIAQNIVAVAALDIDCSAGNYFTKTIAANSTFTFSNVPASRAYAFTLELTHTSGTVTWPTTVKWPGDTAPTLTTGKTHLFTFVTDDGGTRWRGVAQTNFVN